MTMIAICSAFRRPSVSMRAIDIAAVLHRKEAQEEKTEDHYHGHAGEVFPELARTSIATDRFVLLSRLSSTHKINGILLRSCLFHASEKRACLRRPRFTFRG